MCVCLLREMGEGGVNPEFIYKLLKQIFFESLYSF